jgi:hypothetical protein
MTKENYTQLAFNRGLISKLALARQDIKRYALSAETQENWMPRVLGSMMLRPGGQYLDMTDSNNVAVHIPFVFSLSDKAVIEVTASKLRVRVSDTIITRPAVSSAIANGGFDTDLASWTSSDDSGATSSWLTGGYLQLLGTGSAFAKRDQEITVGGADQNVEHGLHIVVTRGPISIRVGSTQGDDDYISATLDTGVHSLALTPTGNFWIRLQAREKYPTLIDSIAVEAAGAMELATNWGANDLAKLRYDQSGDIIFVACEGQQQQKIERRATRSWSVVNYETTDGPFLAENASSTTIAASALNGLITLTASDEIFKSTNVGGIFSIDSIGQKVETTITGENTFTDSIRITGVGTSRTFTIYVSGRTDSTVTLQRSVGVEGDWIDIANYTDGYHSGADGLDNQICYWRIGVKTGNYGTDTITVSLTYSIGSITGVVRLTAIASDVSATAVVLKTLGGTTASEYWAEGSWSDRRGWPSAVALHEGRLFWAGKDKIIGSISDSFYSFDPAYEGAAGVINRSIGSGPVDTINWLISTSTLLVGGEGSVKSARSSSLEEPLTPTNFNLKDITTLGAADVAAVKIDSQIAFVQASGIRVYEAAFDATYQSYGVIDLTGIVPEIGEPAVTKMVVQRQPDTRVHHLRSDGKVAILIYDKVEEVKCWLLYSTDGLVEDIVILPGTTEDEVYYVVNRTIDGGTKRYYEKWALESECKGGTINKLADSFIIYSGASVTTITGLGHLEGESVVVWGNSKSLGTYTVSSGEITGLSEAVTYAIIGLSYTADFKSSKAALQNHLGASLLQKKEVSSLGVMLADTDAQGLKYGPDFDNLDPLPKVEDGATVTADSLWSAYDEEPFPFPGTWDTDSRLCLRATAPKPCTVLCVIGTFNMNEKG